MGHTAKGTCPRTKILRIPTVIFFHKDPNASFFAPQQKINNATKRYNLSTAPALQGPFLHEKSINGPRTNYSWKEK